MRDKIEQILSQMSKGECEPEETIDSLLVLLDVTQRSELLIDFAQSMEAYAIHTSEIELKEGVAKYLKSINCG